VPSKRYRRFNRPNIMWGVRAHVSVNEWEIYSLFVGMSDFTHKTMPGRRRTASASNLPFVECSSHPCPGPVMLPMSPLLSPGRNVRSRRYTTQYLQPLVNITDVANPSLSMCMNDVALLVAAVPQMSSSRCGSCMWNPGSPRV
jgi:hypothetical protein